MPTKTFRGKLFRPAGTGTWTYVIIPFDIFRSFGARGQLKVKGNVNGIRFRSSFLPRGDGTHYLVVKQAICKKAGVAAGDTVKVEFDRDTAKRIVPLPKDFRNALAADPAARNSFNKLSPSHQKKYMEWVTSAKQDTTRQRRIALAVQRILGIGQKRIKRKKKSEQ